MIRVSVVMAAYNAAETIASSIESIIFQSFPWWEFIIVDDCSTDKTLAVIESYSKDDNRITILKNEQNLGLAKSLNIAIANSNGEYIARMDADDASLPKRFEEQVAVLDNNVSVTVVGTGAFFVDRDSGQKRLVEMPEYHVQLLSSIFKKSPFIHPSVMMRREFLLLTHGYRDKYRRAQDYDLWLRGRFIGQYCNIQKPLIYYNSVSGRKFKSVENSIKIRFDNAKSSRDYLLSVVWSCYEIFLYSGAKFVNVFSRARKKLSLT